MKNQLTVLRNIYDMAKKISLHNYIEIIKTIFYYEKHLIKLGVLLEYY